jgi:hypothetical protein
VGRAAGPETWRVRVPAHYEGWSIYSENAADIVRAFDEAGVSQRLHMTTAGTWTL